VSTTARQRRRDSAQWAGPCCGHRPEAVDEDFIVVDDDAQTGSADGRQRLVWIVMVIKYCSVNDNCNELNHTKNQKLAIAKGKRDGASAFY